MIRSFEIVYEMVKGVFIPQKEKTLHFDEINLTITIPKELRVLNKKQMEAREKKRPLVDPATSKFLNNESGCRVLFVARNTETNAMSCIMIPMKERTRNQAEHEYHEYMDAILNKMITSSKRFSRVYYEKKIVEVIISNIPFEKFEINHQTPERIFSTGCFYHGFYKNYQVIFDSAYLNQKTGIKILKNIEDVIFGE